MRLLDYLKQTMTPEEYRRTMYRLSGYTDDEIKRLPPDTDEWLGRGDDLRRSCMTYANWQRSKSGKKSKAATRCVPGC